MKAVWLRVFAAAALVSAIGSGRAAFCASSPPDIELSLSPAQVGAILRQWEGPSEAKARAAFGAAVAVARGHPMEAPSRFLQVAKDFPKTREAEEALFRSTLWLAATDRQEQATDIYQGVIDRYPGTEEAGWARIRLADLYRQDLNRPEEAPAIYAAVAAEFSGDRLEGWALIKLAGAYSETGRHDLAKETYSRGLAAAKDKTAVANDVLATCYWLNASGKKPAVLAAMEALSTAPLDPLLQARARWWIIGFADTAADKAKADAEFAAWGELLALGELESGSSDSLLGALGKIKARLAGVDAKLAAPKKPREQVLNYYRERVHSTKGEPRCHASYLLGGAQLLAGEPDEAISTLQAFLESCPSAREREMALVLLGLGFGRSGREVEGEKFFRRFLVKEDAEQGAAVGAAKGLFFLFQASREEEVALRDLIVISGGERDPRVARALWRVIGPGLVRRAKEAYRERGYLSVMVLLEEARRQQHLVGPGAAELLHLLGLCHQRLNRHVEAIQCFDEALRSNPADARRLGSRYQIGVCHYRMGNFATARENFGLVLADDPEGRLASYANERIRQCGQLLAAREERETRNASPKAQ
jgi:tetratricopeptide (TPR) repeat protein